MISDIAGGYIVSLDEMRSNILVNDLLHLVGLRAEHGLFECTKSVKELLWEASTIISIPK